MFGKNHIFISHSSHNKDIAEQLCVLLSGLGVDKEKIFCSSIVGQGIDNGEKLNEAIANIISKSKLLIFLISYDFISSSYCMEELGVGWYLRQNGKARCFYLVLPDIELSELQGFVNSKIDKFSFVSESHRDDLGLFAENICKVLGTKLPKHSVLLNLENTFFSAIKTSLANIVANRNREKEEEEKRKMEINKLNEQIENDKKIIESLNSTIKTNRESAERKELEIEYSTIKQDFFILGSGGGTKQEYVKSITKTFWTGMINRYLELEDKLEIDLQHKNSNMEFLLAILFSSYGKVQEAYSHFKNYLVTTESGIYYSYFENVSIPFETYIYEIIEILQEKVNKEPMGVVQDSYKKTISNLLEKYGDQNA